MKRVLYLSNIAVPYRVRFFNELAKHCDLTVVYERELSTNRNKAWSQSEVHRYHAEYLHGMKLQGENGFSLGILKYILSDYDEIIIGCYNSPVQMLAILAMRFMRIPFHINLDGEPFLDGNGIKAKLKRFFLRGAKSYLVAGEKAAKSVQIVANGKLVVPYYFSSLSNEELQKNGDKTNQVKRNNTILVVGQFLDYKGIDVALETAQMGMSLPYKFVGMGSRTELFQQTYKDRIPSNVEVIPFLTKKELEQEYRECGMLVLPSRQECWGLVINEAVSFGMPIVSTWGSGAAVEFLSDQYPQYLAQPGDAHSLYNCIQQLYNTHEMTEYGNYLLKKSKKYSIEYSVNAHLRAMNVTD